MKLISDGPENAAITFVLAHGAGAPAQSSWMATVARGLGERGYRVVRFNFPYMEARKKTPDRQPVLLDCWREVIGDLGDPKRLLIGGKSMGGRMASLIADEAGVRGLVCLGYPFHAPGRPQQLRTEHLRELRTPALIVQGTRDQFGRREEVATYDLSRSIRIHWIEGGDHSFKPGAGNLGEAVEAISEFEKSL